MNNTAINLAIVHFIMYKWCGVARFHFHGPLFYYQSQSRSQSHGDTFQVWCLPPPGAGLHYTNYDLEDNNQIENRFASNDRRITFLFNVFFCKIFLGLPQKPFHSFESFYDNFYNDKTYLKSRKEDTWLFLHSSFIFLLKLNLSPRWKLSKKNYSSFGEIFFIRLAVKMIV